MGLANLRLIPVVALAAGALLMLKLAGIVMDRGYALISQRTAHAQGIETPVVGLDPAPQAPVLPPSVMSPAAPPADAASPRGDRARSWAQENLGYPDVTGSVAAKAEPATPPAAAAPPAGAPPAQAQPQPNAQTIDMSKPPMTPGEKAVLESLVQRRQELETRAREIEVRESLLKAAEQRIEQRLQELKDAEARLTGAIKKRDEAEVAKFKNLVSMYENMKAKEAAKIFDRLDMRVLIEVVDLMNPRRMSDILALMSPDAAEKLTLAIAARSGPDRAPAAVELPKIEAKPKS